MCLILKSQMWTLLFHPTHLLLFQDVMYPFYACDDGRIFLFYMIKKVCLLCSVLTVHGSDDTIVRVKEASEFAKIIPNHKLHVVKGANHGFSKHQDELISVVLSFIKEPLNQWCNIKVAEVAPFSNFCLT